MGDLYLRLPCRSLDLLPRRPVTRSFFVVLLQPDEPGECHEILVTPRGLVNLFEAQWE